MAPFEDEESSCPAASGRWSRGSNPGLPELRARAFPTAMQCTCTP